MDCVFVWIVSGFLILEVCVEHKFKEGGLKIQQERVEGENHVHSHYVPIGTYLFEKKIVLLDGAYQLSRTHSLTSREGGYGEIVLAAGCKGITGDFGVKFGGCDGRV